MKIRRARKEDLEECLEMQKLDGGKYWNKDDFVKSIKDKLVIFLTAEEDKKILGYIIGFHSPTKRSDVMIHETRVNKKQRRKGIGTKLVNEFCKYAFKKGGKDIYAEIEPKLLKFYKNSCKFKITHKWIEVKKTKK